MSFAPNTPFSALFFTPLTYFSPFKAKFIFNIISSILLTISVFRLSQYVKLVSWKVIIIPIIFFIPIINNLCFGQVYFLILFLIIEGYLAFKNNKLIAMSIFWSFAIFIKIFPLILVLLLIINKKGKGILFLFLSCLMLLGGSILIQGTEVWSFYLNEVLSRSNRGEIAGLFVDNYQSFFMLCKRLLVFDRCNNHLPFFNAPELVAYFYTFFKIFIIGLTSFLIYKNIKNKDLKTTFSLGIILLSSYLIPAYSSSYGLLVLIPITIFILGDFTHKRVLIPLLLVLFIGLNFGSLFITFEIYLFRYIRLFILLTVLLVLIWNKVNFKSVSKIFILSCLLAFIGFSFETPKETSNIRCENLPLLIFDYDLKKNGISYSYWTNEGIKYGKTNIILNDEIIQKQTPAIIDNQIYIGNSQITYYQSSKRKAQWLDKNTIIYLSDEGKGIGFYGIKTMRLR